jgi:hypothetical protein
MRATLSAFLEASEKALPEDWFDDLLSERESCGRCGETYGVENLMLCPHCLATYCHRCTAGGKQAANGNLACPCGGELVG